MAFIEVMAGVSAATTVIILILIGALWNPVMTAISDLKALGDRLAALTATLNAWTPPATGGDSPELTAEVTSLTDQVTALEDAVKKATTPPAPPATTFTLSPATLPSGTVGTVFSDALTASSGLALVDTSITSGTLPDGVLLAADGTFTGNPTTPGTFVFTVAATDSAGATGTADYTIVIA